MKIKNLHIYILILFTLLIYTGKSQSIDTNTRVTIYSQLVSPDTIDFEFRAERITDEFFTNWANATFMIDFDDDVDLSNIEVEVHPDRSGIPYEDQNEPSYDAYIERIDIADDRIAIGLLGPEVFDSTLFLPLNPNEATVLGRFRVFTKDGTPFPRGTGEEGDGVRFKWLRPHNFYQDFAYKTDKPIDSLSVEGWFQSDDNISALNEYTTVNFEDDDSDRPEMILDYFVAKYIGNLKVVLDWKTTSEAFNKGFIIKRGRMPFSSNDPEAVNYDTDVADYRNPQDEAVMTGLGTRVPGKTYRYSFDTVDLRNTNYCYELLYQDFNDEIHSLAKACVAVPNAVLTYLQANPNPADEEAQVEFTVEDDVYLTARLYNLRGREIMSFYEDQFFEIGTHTFTINIPENLSSGMYDIILVAIPINDKSVEQSTGVFKLQVIK